MQKLTFAIPLAAAGLLAASNTSIVWGQQSGATGRDHGRVISAAPVYSQSMLELRHAAQRLRESIQSLAQEPVGPRRDQAMRDAHKALNDTQQAMIQLPPEYRVSGIVTTTGHIHRGHPAQNRTYGDSMQELQLAADRLRDSIHAMADQPAGPRRNEAIKQVNEALLETQEAMAWVPGYASMSSASAKSGLRDTGSVLSRAGSGSVAGSIVAGSDASRVSAEVPAVAGGVGLNARAVMSSEARPGHNVKMVFALNTGNYLADVAVTVKDADGRTVIDGVSDGPWLYAKLPPGNYTATATYNGQTASQRFSVGRSGQRVAYFRWPANVEQASTAGISPILGTGPEMR